jgi:hypothetical protein
MTLNNPALLYRATERNQKAEEAYSEALATRRKLAEANPEAYLPDLTITLNARHLLSAASWPRPIQRLTCGTSPSR